MLLMPTETRVIEGEGFTAIVREENGFIAQAIAATYSIPRAQVETLLVGKGYDLRGCEWSFVPDASTPATYIPNTDEIPIGRVLIGDGWRASLRYTETSYEAVYIDGQNPEAGIQELSRKGVTIAPDCIVWRLPATQPSPNPKVEAETHRTRFFGVLRGRQHVFGCFGLDEGIIKRYYYNRFGVQSLSALTVVQWAIAAAEMACMADNVDILSRRAPEIRRAQGGAV